VPAIECSARAPQGGEPDEAQGDADAQADDERRAWGGWRGSVAEERRRREFGRERVLGSFEVGASTGGVCMSAAIDVAGVDASGTTTAGTCMSAAIDAPRADASGNTPMSITTGSDASLSMAAAG
jgi:hypothetical protein